MGFMNGGVMGRENSLSVLKLKTADSSRSLACGIAGRARMVKQSKPVTILTATPNELLATIHHPDARNPRSGASIIATEDVLGAEQAATRIA
jgi:hypothetical protein